MKRCIILATLTLLISSAWATQWYHLGWFMEFPDGIPEEYLVDRDGPHAGVVITSPPIPSCHANQLHSRLAVTLALYTSPEQFRGSVEIRCSMDALHWSEWMPLNPRLPSEEIRSLTGFQCDDGREPPDLSGASIFFDGLFPLSDGQTQWHEVHREWSANHPEEIERSYTFVQWVCENRPELFEEGVGINGYLQYRILEERHEPSVQRLYLGMAKLQGGGWWSREPAVLARWEELSHSWDILYPGMVAEGERYDFRGSRGDVDRSGECDVRDLVLLTDHVSFQRRLHDPIAVGNADVNADGQINGWDVEALAKKLLGVWDSHDRAVSQQ